MYVFEGANFTITDQHRTPFHVVILSKIVTAFEVCFHDFPVTQTRTCRSMILLCNYQCYAPLHKKELGSGHAGVDRRIYIECELVWHPQQAVV